MKFASSYPAGIRRDIVIDSDAANETDDQYALSWALMNPEAFRVRGIYAAPYLHPKVLNEGAGMADSYQEIARIAALFPELDVPFFFGARRFLDRSPVTPSPAAEHLIALSRNYDEKQPLIVVAIGALTNLATALALDPSLERRIELFWLGGQDYSRPAGEFNLDGDAAATARVINSGLKTTLFPCAGIAETLRLSVATAREKVLPCGALGRLLYNRLTRMIGDEDSRDTAIWDLAPFLALSRPEFMDMVWLPRRELRFHPSTWGAETESCWWMNRAIDVDAAFEAFFARLSDRHDRCPNLPEPEF